MQINWKTTTKILAAIVATDTAVGLYNLYVVNPKNQKLFTQLKEQRDAARELSQLFAKKLDDNGIEVTAFDRIVMDNLYNT
jgi:hypothetical protein